jgi:hypothetical protein
MARGTPAPCFQCRTNSKGTTPGNRQEGKDEQKGQKRGFGDHVTFDGDRARVPGDKTLSPLPPALSPSSLLGFCLLPSLSAPPWVEGRKQGDRTGPVCTCWKSHPGGHSIVQPSMDRPQLHQVQGERKPPSFLLQAPLRLPRPLQPRPPNRTPPQDHRGCHSSPTASSVYSLGQASPNSAVMPPTTLHLCSSPTWSQVRSHDPQVHPNSTGPHCQCPYCHLPPPIPVALTSTHWSLWSAVPCPRPWVRVRTPPTHTPLHPTPGFGEGNGGTRKEKGERSQAAGGGGQEGREAKGVQEERELSGLVCDRPSPGAPAPPPCSDTPRSAPAESHLRVTDRG